MTSSTLVKWVLALLFLILCIGLALYLFTRTSDTTEEVDTVTKSSDIFEFDTSVSTAVPLEGTSWVWTGTVYQDGTKYVPMNPVFVLSFLEGGSRVSGTTDCNNISASYAQNGEVLSFSPFAATLMYCSDTVEDVYVDELALTNSYVISGDELRLNLNRDYGTMYFVKK